MLGWFGSLQINEHDSCSLRDVEGWGVPDEAERVKGESGYG